MSFVGPARNCVGGVGVKHLLDALETNYTLLTLDRALQAEELDIL